MHLLKFDKRFIFIVFYMYVYLQHINSSKLLVVILWFVNHHGVQKKFIELVVDQQNL
jgi:hypothetical protein